MMLRFELDDVADSLCEAANTGSELHVCSCIFKWKGKKDKKTDSCCRIPDAQQVVSTSTFSVFPSYPVLMSVASSFCVGQEWQFVGKIISCSGCGGYTSEC